MKFIGYVLIWFTFLVLASMVYVQGEPLGSIWYEVAAGLAVLVTFLSALAMTRTNGITARYGSAMVILAILLVVLAPFLVV